MRFTHIDFHTYPKQQELIRITFPTLELVNRHRCPKFHLEIRGRGRGLSEAHFPTELCRENGSFVVGIRHKQTVRYQREQFRFSLSVITLWRTVRNLLNGAARYSGINRERQERHRVVNNTRQWKFMLIPAGLARKDNQMKFHRSCIFIGRYSVFDLEARIVKSLFFPFFSFFSFLMLRVERVNW